MCASGRHSYEPTHAPPTTPGLARLPGRTPSGRSARQRLASGRDAERLELLALSRGAFDQRAEVDLDEPIPRVREVAHVRPEKLFAVETEGKRLELEEPAQRRVAAQLPVRLQPADALRDERERTLHPAEGNPQALHDLFERVDVLGHLARKSLQERAELGARVLRRRAPGELASCDSESELVVEVDPE